MKKKNEIVQLMDSIIKDKKDNDDNLQNDNMLFADSESWCSYKENNNEFFSDFVK